MMKIESNNNDFVEYNAKIKSESWKIFAFATTKVI